MKLKVGDLVVTNDYDVGFITEIEDTHNIYVEYINCDGSGIHCVVKGCILYSPLRILT